MQYTAQVDLAPNYATHPRQAYVCAFDVGERLRACHHMHCYGLGSRPDHLGMEDASTAFRGTVRVQAQAFP
jgi:hypothetical protein